MTLMKLWLLKNQSLNLKVRWSDWNWRHKYFEIKSFDPKTRSFHGQLDCGESISYPAESPHWSFYTPGEEAHPKVS